jgi:hypothetical protein
VSFDVGRGLDNHPRNSSVLYDSNALPPPITATDVAANTDVVMMELDGEAEQQQHEEDKMYPRFNMMNQHIWSRIQQLFASSETTELPSTAGNGDDGSNCR